MILSFLVVTLALNAIADRTMKNYVKAIDKKAEWKFMGWHNETERVFYNERTHEIMYLD